MTIVANSPDQLLEALVSHFEAGQKRPVKTKSGYYTYRVHCPLHKDKTASLDISWGRREHAVLYCHASCDTGAILGAVGLSYSDLYLKDLTQPARPYKRRQIPLRECIEAFSLVGWCLHLYGRDRLAGAPFNETTFWERMADLRAIAQKIDYRDFGQFINALHSFAMSIPESWNEDCAQVFFNEYLRIRKELNDSTNPIH